MFWILTSPLVCVCVCTIFLTKCNDCVLMGDCRHACLPLCVCESVCVCVCVCARVCGGGGGACVDIYVQHGEFNTS